MVRSSDTQRCDLTLAEFTGATVSDAQRLLKQFRWDLDRATNGYWDDDIAQDNAARAAASSGPQASRPKIEAVFNQYSGKSGDKDTIDLDGTMEYCEALGVTPDDVAMLAVAELCAAPEMGVFGRKGFVDGWAKARCVICEPARDARRKDTIESQRSYLPSLRSDLTSNVSTFRRVYGFAFDYFKTPGSRSLPFDSAQAVWDLMLPNAPAAAFASNSAWNPHRDAAQAQQSMQRWQRYLETENKGRPISKDVWSQFLDFAFTMDAAFDNFDAEAAWPSIIDGFVDHSKVRDRSLLD